jgi:hypothetical protein
VEKLFSRSRVQVTRLHVFLGAEQPIKVRSDACGGEELVDPVVVEIEENLTSIEGEQPTDQLDRGALEAERIDERKCGCQSGTLLLKVSNQSAGGFFKTRLLTHDRDVWRQSTSSGGEGIQLLHQTGIAVQSVLEEEEHELTVHLREEGVGKQRLKGNDRRTGFAVLIDSRTGEAVEEYHPFVLAAKDREPCVEVKA